VNQIQSKWRGEHERTAWKQTKLGPGKRNPMGNEPWGGIRTMGTWQKIQRTDPFNPSKEKKNHVGAEWNGFGAVKYANEPWNRIQNGMKTINPYENRKRKKKKEPKKYS